MIARIKQYFLTARCRVEILEEARELLAALDLTSAPAQAPADELMNILMTIGVGHLRAAKKSHDAVKAAREMELRIQQGPRPNYQEAQDN